MVLLNLELQCAAPLRYNQTELFCTLTRYLILNHISDSEYVVSYRYSLHYFILSLYINSLYINSLYTTACTSTAHANLPVLYCFLDIYAILSIVQFPTTWDERKFSKEVGRREAERGIS